MMTEDWPGRVRHQARLHTVASLLESGLLLLLDLLLESGHRGVDLVLLGLGMSHSGRHRARTHRAGRGQSSVQSGHDLVSLSVMARAGGCRHALDSPQSAGTGMSLTSLELLDALRNTQTAASHLLALLVTVQEVRRGRGQELHAAPGRGVVALGLLLLADDARGPPGWRSRSPPATDLAAAPP